MGVELEGVFTHKSEHDEYSRITEKNLTLANATTPLLSDEITYISSATRLTNMVSTVAQNINGNEQRKLRYHYDNNGNIIAINDITEIESETDAGTPIAAYTYDEMNQLVREDNYLLNKTYIFTYDTSGNILSKKTFNSVLTTETGTPDSIINYTYASTGWKDQLISFGGETITYDVLGNPTTYRGHSLTWGKLRQLNSFDSNTFTYNANGIRTSKNNITYTLDGTKILSETRPTGTIKYLYGMNGVIGFTYNGNTYYYEKNVHGDVTAIVDVNGTIKAKYNYDAWGNHTITLDTDGIGTLNPIRYRSYYFDTETGLYYLNSRYYDPAACRFINADSIIDAGGILGYNMFAYCNNNPIANCDPTGMSSDNIQIGDDIGAIYYVNYNFLKHAGHCSLFYKYNDEWYMIQLKSQDLPKLLLEIGVAVVTLFNPVVDHTNGNIIIYPLDTYAIEQLEYIGDSADVKNRIISRSKGRYDIIYLPGDFSAIHTDDMPNKGDPPKTIRRRYNLLNYNCNHYIKQKLKECNNQEVINNFGNSIIPSQTFKTLKKHYKAESR